MNEADPRDPFLPMLEDALAMPDLELGHEMRHRLLAAAVSQEQSPEGGNVVPFVKRDGEADAFQWLVGEREADHALMLRLTEDAGFFTEVSRERRFLHTLRRSLRLPTPATAVPEPVSVPAAPRRFHRAAAGAVAAVLALWLGLKSFDAVPEVFSGGEPAQVVGTPAKAAPRHVPAGPASAAGEGQVVKVAPLTRERVAVSPALASAETPRVGEAITAAVEPAEDTGTAPAPEIAQVEKIVAQEQFGSAAVEAFDSVASIPDGNPVASLVENDASGGASEWGFWSGGLASNVGRNEGSFSYVNDGEGNLAVPEPGGAILFWIGGMFLMTLRRRKKGR